jgi:aminoglycoside phosphotransferase family enzyme/predicted kinase
MPALPPPLIRSLSEPGVLWPGAERATLIETHISWVLLAGPHAWKIKKPVDLGFVDFTTLERRRHFCEEELQLNRRLAPSLYLEVVAISGAPDGPRVGAPGNAIEYAVKMQRFAQEGLLSRAAEEARLLPRHIDDLAVQLSAFHLAASRSPPDVTYGQPLHVIRDARDVLAHLKSTPAATPFTSELDHLTEWIASEAKVLETVLLGRVESGWIRECHGDLHLGNIVLLDDHPTCFDGIEFNPRLRWIDVQSEIAFLVMDLQRHHRYSLANRFRNAYLEQTGDYAGLRVLPFYAVYRALVRAMVDGLRMAQGSDPAHDARLELDLRDYLAVAKHWTSRPPAALSITCGVSGSGKTTGTQSLLDETGAIRIRSDVERKRLMGLAPSARSHSGRDQGLYSSEVTARTYARLADLCDVVLKAGFPAIVDATFLKRSQRQQFQRIARDADVPFQILAFEADEATLHRRVAKRAQAGTDASEATPAMLERQLCSREAFTTDELPHIEMM